MSLAASAAMGGFMMSMRRAGVLGEPPPRKLIRKVFGRRRATGPVVAMAHFAYGATVGAVYGAAASFAPRRWQRVVAGGVFGLAVWAVSYAGWVPASGLMLPPSVDRPGRPVTMVLAHLLFGVTMGLLLPRQTSRQNPR